MIPAPFEYELATSAGHALALLAEHGEDAKLLAENPHPTEQEVREGLEGNFCRCTGYHNIVRSVLAAADKLSGSSPAAEVPADGVTA